MTRRDAVSGLTTIVGGFALIGIAVLALRFFVVAAPFNRGEISGLLVFIVALGVLCLVARHVFRSIGRQLAQDRLDRAFDLALRKTLRAVERNKGPLSTRRAQLVQADPYGKPKLDAWMKEIGYFVRHHVEDTLNDDERAALRRKPGDVADMIERTIEAQSKDDSDSRDFSDAMTPVDFENYCAERLRSAGWDARVTMQSRDQGIDVVAAKNGVRVVLQCKLYATPVGNKAVQEAAAGRAHENADHAAVVTNSRFTPSAEQLAATNGVLLLHHRDLANLESTLVKRLKRTPSVSA